MPTQKKIDKVEEMTSLFKETGSFFITDYQGLNVADMTGLRKTLREGEVRYVVAKNTLLKLAAKNAETPDLDEHLSGPTAVAFTTGDPAAAAKIIYDHAKEKELPKVRAFVLDGVVYGPDEMKRLAELPSREQLLAQVVAAVEAPFSQLVGSLDGFFRELVGSIDALADKKKAEG